MANVGADFRLIEARDELISKSVKMIEETAELYHARGEPDSGRLQRLEALKQSVSENQLKIATIGEFSRGKSSLINALIGLELLPTAQEQTTAINCFISGLDAEHPEPCIEINNVDGTLERLDYSYDALLAWSTELNQDNKDAREVVDRIHIHTDHELFQRRVTLIDTPGFQGILERHEDIARAAMDEAHVALWVQDTTQLGGNKTEWDFMRESVAKNFNNFITVINMWDRVLETTDRRAQGMSSEEWERNRIKHVQAQFHSQAEGVLEPEKIKRLSDENNLIGVSALWGVSEDPSKRARSNIQRLAQRIEEMISEGQADILISPLKKLLNEHVTHFIDRLEQQRASLDDNKSLEERKRELELLETQILQLDMKLKAELDDTRVEHEYQLRSLLGDLDQLVEPIKELKQELDHSVTESYVKRVLERAIRKGEPSVVSLSAEHKEEFESRIQTVQSEWPQIKMEAESKLQSLARQFLDKMKEGAAGLMNELSGVQFEFPEVQISVKADLSDVIRHHESIENAKRQIEAKEDEISDLEIRLAQGELTQREAERKRQERERAIESYRTRIGKMGPPPPPEKTAIYESTSGWGSSDYIAGYETDTSAHDAHLAMVQNLERLQADERGALQEIQREFQAKHQEQLTQQQAKKKLQMKRSKLERELKKSQEGRVRAIDDEVKSSHRLLRRKTVRELEKIQVQIEKQAKAILTRTFEQHQAQLRALIEQHYLIPIREAKQSHEQTTAAIESGEAEAEQLRAQIAELQGKVTEHAELIEYFITKKIPSVFG